MRLPCTLKLSRASQRSHPNSPLNVLLVVTSSDIGGTEKTVRDLAMRLDRELFTPAICSLRSCGTMGREAALQGTPVFTLGMAESPRLGEVLRSVVALRRLINELQIDLIQSFLYRANLVARLSARLSPRRPLVVSGQRSLASRRPALALLCDRFTQSLSCHTIAVSAAVKEDLARTQGIAADRVTVIANGVPRDVYGGNHGNSRKVALKVPNDCLLIGTVCRLSPEKGVTYLVDATAILRQRGTPIYLIIAGDGPERQALARQVRSSALERYVRFLGWRSALGEVYSALDIFVLPSLEEGAPNVLLEAMASGCAVIATAVGGNVNLVEEKNSGLLVSPADSAALANAITHLAGDAALRQRLGRNAKKRVGQRFTVERMVHEYERLYRKLLRENKGVLV